MVDELIVKQECIDEPGVNLIKQPKIPLIIILVAVLAPIYIMFFPWNDEIEFQIAAMTWLFYYESSGFFFYPDPLIWIQLLPLIFLRFAFVYQMLKYYKGNTTRKSVIVVGIISELQLWITLIPLYTIFVLPFNPEYFPIYVPIPDLLITSLLLMKLRPIKEATTPWIERVRTLASKPVMKKKGDFKWAAVALVIVCLLISSIFIPQPRSTFNLTVWVAESHDTIRVSINFIWFNTQEEAIRGENTGNALSFAVSTDSTHTSTLDELSQDTVWVNLTVFRIGVDDEILEKGNIVCMFERGVMKTVTVANIEITFLITKA